jgi:predicted nucleic acid-binding Zn ribbon protein
MNTCKNCGIEIESHRTYCSLTCRNIYVNKYIRNYNKNGESISKKSKDVYNLNPKICKVCGKKIDYKLRDNITCSGECKKNNLIDWNKNRKGEKRNFTEEGISNIRKATKIRLGIVSNVSDYNLNPNCCKECNTILSYIKRNNTFCNIDCKRISDKKNMSEYQKYHRECQFNFSLNDYPNEFDFELISKYGWYQAKNRGNNLNGISRDHMISVKYGYENNINPNIIKHPANCKIMRHNENSSKCKKCSITLDDLLNRINIWNEKYMSR